MPPYLKMSKTTKAKTPPIKSTQFKKNVIRRTLAYVGNIYSFLNDITASMRRGIYGKNMMSANCMSFTPRRFPQVKQHLPYVASKLS